MKAKVFQSADKVALTDELNEFLEREGSVLKMLQNTAVDASDNVIITITVLYDETAPSETAPTEEG